MTGRIFQLNREGTLTDRVRRSKLLRLAHLMNRQNDTSVFVSRELIDVFDCVISDQEADLLLAMGTSAMTRSDILSLSGMNEDEFNRLFRDILSKGVVWMKTGPDGNDIYSVAPIMVGWFEVFLMGGDRTPVHVEFARRVDNLFRYWKKFNIFPVRHLRNLKQRFDLPNHGIVMAPGRPGGSKRIEVNVQVDQDETRVEETGKVLNLIERYGALGQIVLVHCFCREWRAMTGGSCQAGLPSKGCLVVGDFARAAAEYFGGNELSTGEACDLVRGLAARGAVHMVFHERENVLNPEIGICNCCRDCCGILGSYNRGITGLKFRVNAMASIVEPGSCNGCGLCAGRCPVFAIRMDDRGVTLDNGLCIGCGQCEACCRRGVFRMERGVRTAILPLLKPSRVNIRD